MAARDLVGPFNGDLVATAKQRYLLLDPSGRIVVRDRLVDLAHEEGAFTPRMKMVMYFLFMFRDSRYRSFICEIVGAKNGKWDTSVFRSTSMDFFEDEGGRKAFTNLRRFLIHTGILNEESYMIQVPPLGSWFPAAVEIAAQYIENRNVRQHFLASPHGFLIKYRLNALLNASPEELSAVQLGGTYEESPDLLPEYEIRPGENVINTFDFRPWERVAPAERGSKEDIYSTTDPAALERANYQHFVLERMIAQLCRECGLQAKTNQHIDLLAEARTWSIIFEMKSSSSRSVRSQIRRAVSQLLEYSFLYRECLRKNKVLCIVIERKPRGANEWLIEFVSSLGIGLIWKNDKDDRLNCTETARELLGEIIPAVLQPDFKPRTQ